jgi:hypothetical protein
MEAEEERRCQQNCQGELFLTGMFLWRFPLGKHIRETGPEHKFQSFLQEI